MISHLVFFNTSPKHKRNHLEIIIIIITIIITSIIPQSDGQRYRGALFSKSLQFANTKSSSFSIAESIELNGLFSMAI
jgi:hypothetical protein